MEGTITLTDHDAGGSNAPNHGVPFGLLRALARGLRRSRERSERGPETAFDLTSRPESADRPIVDATGNLCDTRLLQAFQRRCEEALSRGRRGVVVDLANVTSADTKLVAALITLFRRAQSVGVPFELTVSSRVYGWITHCRVEHLLHARCVQRQPRTCTRAPGEAPGQGRLTR